MSAPVGEKLTHDAASLHVSGSAPYIDDLPEYKGTLHVALGLSTIAHGKIQKLDLSTVKKSEGVVDVIDISSIPGNPSIAPVLDDEKLFADKKVEFVGQVIFAVCAQTREQALQAVRLANITIIEFPAVLSIEQALKEKSFIVPQTRMPVIERNWNKKKLDESPRVLKGTQKNGGQEHFYLEGQIAVAVPLEKNGMLVHTSTQHLAEVQHMVAHALDIPSNAVETRVRRLGGGFGGKEVQAIQSAVIASIFASRTKCPVKLRLSRPTDFLTTGKRHPFLNTYKVGFNEEGKILAIDIKLASDCGISTDLSLAILDRAVFHADNAYYLPNVRIRGFPCRTNKVSNTAFRGFGGPQGMLIIEKVIEDIARELGLDPLDIRRTNFYQGKQQRAPFGQLVFDNILPELVNELAHDSKYSSRRRKIEKFNKSSTQIKRAISLTPVKFGISFSVLFLNQSGALVNVYKDGTIVLNHGGIEMGQGLFQKVAQVVASVFGVTIDKVRCEPTSTAKVPNTSATAASAGTDLNGKSSEQAALIIRNRLATMAAEIAGCKASEVMFEDNMVLTAQKSWSFKDLVARAYMSCVALSSTGFYSTPKLSLDADTRLGSPFFYFTYGAAVSEVAIDTLTGEHRLLRVDILHDVGNSINPAIDIGQIEGGYAQGYGWLTSEELAWNDKGVPLSIGPATYKIPTAGDMPEKFIVKLWPQPNSRDTVCRSKAVGEPPLMLAISAFTALSEAVAYACNSNKQIEIAAPMTPERVLLAIQDHK